jgi:regulator of protease activity HflC (stomatin/prohibitin superfamily)
MKVTDIFGSQKSALQDSVTKQVQRLLKPEGIIVDQLSIIGKIRVDPQVESSINAVLTASQKAIEAQNKVNQARAEAEQMIQTARGDSAAANIRAVGQAEANRKLNATLTPALIQSQWIARWDGKMPEVTAGGSSTPMLLNLPSRGQ